MLFPSASIVSSELPPVTEGATAALPPPAPNTNGCAPPGCEPPKLNGAGFAALLLPGVPPNWNGWAEGAVAEAAFAVKEKLGFGAPTAAA